MTAQTSMKNATPAKRALAVLDQEKAEVSPAAKRRVPKKIALAVDLLVTGECKQINDAAEKAGVARETLSRALNKPHVAEFMRQKVVRTLNKAAMRAGATKVELLDSPSELVRDRASSFVLGLAGITPAAQASVNVSVDVRAGWVVDLREPEERAQTSAPAPKVIDHV